MTLFRSGVVVAFFTLISRIFGLARELFIASLFGADNLADSVNVAFKLPNLFRRIFGEGALSTVFVPIFNEKILESKGAAQHFTGAVFSILLLTLIIIILLMQLFMPYLMYMVAPGFYKDPAKFELTVLLCRITMPYLVFISITALFGGILNSIKKFAAFAFSPVILSIVVIIATLILKQHIDPPISICCALIIAGILQVLFMFYCVARAKLLFPINFNPANKDVRKFLTNMGPATITSGVQQLNLFISQSLASFIEGAVSILSYADRIYQFPLSIIGISFSTILLPELSRVYRLKDLQQATKIQNHAVKTGLLLALPAAFGIIALSQPIIHIIYERGAFNAENTIKTAEAISAFALGLPAFILSKILTPIFYANHDTKTPLKITIYSLSTNIILNIILMKPFGHIGIALGSSIAGWYNFWLLYKYSKMHGNFQLDANLKSFCFKILISCCIMTAMIALICFHYSKYFYSESLLIKTTALGGTIILAMVAFLLAALGFKLHKNN